MHRTSGMVVVGAVLLLTAVLSLYLRVERTPSDRKARSVAGSAPSGTTASGTRWQETKIAPPPAPAPTGASTAPEALGGNDPRATDTVGYSIEVVDEGGHRVVSGSVSVNLATLDVDRLQSLTEAFVSIWSAGLESHDLSAANPCEVRNGPGEFSGVRLVAAALTPGLAPPDAAEFVLEAGKVIPVRLVATQARSLSVRVVDESTGTPVEGASVVSFTELRRRRLDPEDLPSPHGAGWATTATDGTCRLEGLGPGTHWVEVTADGFRIGQVRELGFDTDRVIVRLAREKQAGSLIVTVLGPRGVPVAGVLVRLDLRGHGGGLSKETNAGGEARFMNVEPGAHDISLDRTGLARAIEGAAVPPGQAVDLTTVTIAPGETSRAVLGYCGEHGSADVQVVDATGTAVRGAIVRLFGPASLETTTEDSGRARIEGMPPGRYWVILRRQFRWYESEQVVVEGGCRVDLRLRCGGMRIRGRVSAGDRTIEGAEVMIRGSRFATATTAADGSFEVGEALPGEYRIEVIASGLAAGAARVALVEGQDPPPVEIVLQVGGRVLVRTPVQGGKKAPTGLCLEAQGGARWAIDEESAGEFFARSERLSPGHYDLVWETPDGRMARLPVVIQDGRDVEVTLAER